MHYIVCENCNYSNEYLSFIKNSYLKYEFITRYLMQLGTDPETYYQFFWGLATQFNDNPITKFFIFFLIILLVLLIKFIFKIKLIYKNISKIIKYIIISINLHLYCYCIFVLDKI